ncbi:MAG: hypothetical protein KDD62_08900 [Bdellovibrionales bacterium]|nr:hypothetical protein [Bdellovibrionales bacterium]
MSDEIQYTTEILTTRVSFDVDVRFDCPECNKEHTVSFFGVQTCGADEYKSSTIHCECGVKINYGLDFGVDDDVEAVIPIPEEDLTVVKPAPNQIDMFTGRTLSDKQ